MLPQQHVQHDRHFLRLIDILINPLWHYVKSNYNSPDSTSIHSKTDINHKNENKNPVLIVGLLKNTVIIIDFFNSYALKSHRPIFGTPRVYVLKIDFPQNRKIRKDSFNQTRSNLFFEMTWLFKTLMIMTLHNFLTPLLSLLSHYHKKNVHVFCDVADDFELP